MQANGSAARSARYGNRAPFIYWQQCSPGLPSLASPPTTTWLGGGSNCSSKPATKDCSNKNFRRHSNTIRRFRMNESTNSAKVGFTLTQTTSLFLKVNSYISSLTTVRSLAKLSRMLIVMKKKKELPPLWIRSVKSTTKSFSPSVTKTSK